MSIVFEKPKALTDAPLHYCPGCTHGIIHRPVSYTHLDVYKRQELEARTLLRQPVDPSRVRYVNAQGL